MKKLTSAIALIGFMISPSSLHFKSATTQDFLVTNGAKDPAHFEIYADDYENYFVIQPASFDLPTGGNQHVSVAVSKTPDGSIATNISILSNANSSGAVAFQTGIKLPVTASPKINSNLKASIGDFASSLIEHWLLTLIAVMLIVSILIFAKRQGPN